VEDGQLGTAAHLHLEHGEPDQAPDESVAGLVDGHGQEQERVERQPPPQGRSDQGGNENGEEQEGGVGPDPPALPAR
jgi:hypothetical protein